MNIIRPRYYLPITSAIARDAACWQLDRTEDEVGDLLDRFESCIKDLNSTSATTSDFGVVLESR